jgi:hypothetical protein
MRTRDIRTDRSLGKLDVQRIDLNKDGYVSGRAELGALFTQIAATTKSSTADCVQLVKNGNQTQAGDMLESVQEHARDENYLTPKHRAMRIAGFSAMGLGTLALGLIGVVGLAPAALLVSVGSALALAGGARPPVD